MVDFNYKPKFVDIRASTSKSAAKGPRAEKPVAQACDHTGCPKPGDHKAPKTSGGKGQYWHFCQQHAGEYNRRYDFFKDMSEDQLAAHRAAEETGHRPTWKFRAGKGDRVSAGRFFKAAKPGDTFGLFDSRDAPKAAPAKKRVGRVQGMALDVLALEENASAEAIRTRYAELVKRYHPDSNGGDRSAEAQLQKVIRAFKTLKAAGLT
jgi:DnaJ-domain-containing protein 1